MDDDGLWVRPRGRAWGNEAQRAVLHAIAEDLAKRTHHKVVAIEALRPDGYLEFVAIAGDDAARDKMLGQASPLELDHIHQLGVEMAGWRHIPSERLDEQTRAWLDEFGHRPDVPASGLPNGWDPDDQMVRLLHNEDGELRGLLYLDEPLSGLRPTTESVAAVNAEAGVLFDAVISIVERELYGEQVRMVAQARRAIESVRPGLGVQELLSELSTAMVEAMDVATVDVIAVGSEVAGIEEDQPLVTELMRAQWERRGHVVVERQRTWSMQEESIATPPSLTRLLDTHDLGSGLLVPIGAGEEYLGTLSMGRAPDAPRWNASEINAATTVASDLARLLLEARLVERERTLHAELRAVSDYRRDMVLTLAHELRNPVSVLFSHLELLGLETHSEESTHSLEALDRAARRIEDMVADLMTLASVSDPDGAAATGEVDLSALVQETSDFLAPTASRAGVEMTTVVADGLVVTGDPAGLQRMVSNLLANGVKYTPEGGRVAMGVEQGSVDGVAGVLITCTDTGIGIAADEVDKVFAPFFRSSSPEARKRPGTGLGLAIIERVVTGHDGTVEVESVLGEGTTFTVWLPVGGTRAPR
ncbi:HAMP domain-containing sensor histidine kinase [Nocardioides sp. STR2]|uniref:Sensor-like histidine kinase SenX3 n=1 Tax=Nocardioides pini TaxID=2975053 RepID=A0ABT4CG91_9ACTN|nr:HAMP domain-containing sensor histidine kinase [Nocardioides pini]MCY4727988.1 HAMP domain-containing sensor histidine kinase [Nocardioides pini]